MGRLHARNWEVGRHPVRSRVVVVMVDVGTWRVDLRGVDVGVASVAVST